MSLTQYGRKINKKEAKIYKKANKIDFKQLLRGGSMTKNLFERIDGVFMPVIDLDESIIWYKDILGLTLLYTWDGGAGFKVNEGDSLLGLIHVKDHFPAFFSTQESKMHYFNFKTLDIENSCKLLKDRGVEMSEIIDAGKIKIAYFQDPNGNLLGMCEEVK